MWPRLLDMTKEESLESLRNLELQTYSSLVSVLRAQGSLNNDKRRVLKETGILLNISNDRHKTEIRKAVNDEKLHTIAYHMTGRINSTEEWTIEGRRLVPRFQRAPSQTVYYGSAEESSELTSLDNNELPFPSDTRRKRPAPQIFSPVGSPTSTHSGESSENLTFRIPEVPKEEQPKRKRHHSIGENSTLAQHLLGTKSLSKIQQIYRQSSTTEEPKISSEISPSSDTEDSHTTTIQQPTATTSRINVIENITLPSCKNNLEERTSFSVISPNDTHEPEPVTVYHQNSLVHQSEQFVSSEYESSVMHHKPFIGTCDIENMSVMLANEVPDNQNSFFSNENFCVGENQVSLVHLDENQTHQNQQTFYPNKNINFVAEQQTVNAPQVIIPKQFNKKVTVQTLPANSILQKTLSVPMNKLTKLNLEKFKLLPNSNIQLPSKPKLLTFNSNMSKKIIPLSQLQMLQNTKGSLKMVPPSYLVDKAMHFNHSNNFIPENNGIQQQEMNGVAVGNGEKITENVHKIENDIRISTVEELDSNDSMETLSTASNEFEEVNFIEDLTNPEEINVNDCEFLKTYEEYHQETGEVLEDFEIIHTEEFLN